MSRGIVKLQIETLAHLLQQHLDIVESLRNTSTLLARSPGYSVEVERGLEQLTEVRRSMIEALRVLKGSSIEGEDREDLIALTGYIVEAACRSERRVLDKLRGRVNVEHHLDEVSELESEARVLMSILSRGL